MWFDHYKSLLNSIPTCSEKDNVNSVISEVEFENDMFVTVAEVSSALMKLKTGKAAGHDGLSSEHFKFASARLTVCLSMCFTAMFIHGYLPDCLIKSVISPIIKDKAGDATDKNNYRPIALTSICSKFFENVILNRCEHLFNVSDNQFGFSKKVVQQTCVFLPSSK